MKKILFGLALIGLALGLTACNCKKEREEIRHEIPAAPSETSKPEAPLIPEVPKSETEIK